MSVGRPTKYKKEFVEQVYKLTCGGFIDKQIADFFGVSKQQLNRWKQKYPDFFESLKKGKEEFDTQDVEACLLKRALGKCKSKETTKELSTTLKPKTGKPFMRITKEVIKTIPPDVAAGFIWLKNRNPDRWRDRTELQHGGVIHLYTQPMKIPKDAGT